jgi:hypothetical protein
VLNLIDNNISDTSILGGNMCGLAPSFPTNTLFQFKPVDPMVIIYPNPNSDGRLNVKQEHSKNLYFEITSINGVLLTDGNCETLRSEIKLPDKAGMYYMLFYHEGAVVAKMKVIRL